MNAAPTIEKTHLIGRILMGCILCFGVLSAILTLRPEGPADSPEESAEASGILTLSSEALEEFQAEVSQSEALPAGVPETPAKDLVQADSGVLERVQPEFSSRAELIRAIQAELKRLGYDTGAPDGMMGPRTRKAIREFEKDEGFTESGEPSVSLYKNLLEAANTAY